MPTFRCKDAGATCNWSASGSSEDEVLRKVAAHVQRKHKVETVTQTIANFARTAIRGK